MTTKFVKFELTEKKLKAVGLNTASTPFLLAVALASLKQASRQIGAEGAWEKLERAFKKTLRINR